MMTPVDLGAYWAQPAAVSREQPENKRRYRTAFSQVKHRLLLLKGGGQGRGRTADLPLFRPDISQVAADRASVLRCRRPLPVVVAVAVTVAVSHDPGNDWTAVTRLCAWCENPIPARARRDAVTCDPGERWESADAHARRRMRLESTNAEGR